MLGFAEVAIIVRVEGSHGERTDLIISTISSVLASVAALAAELRARRGNRGVSDAHNV